MSVQYYENIATEAANEYGLNPTAFIDQIMGESSFDPNANSGKAYGIAQFTPSTAAQYGVDVTDPISSIYGAAAYDSDLLSQCGGDWECALSGYTGSSNPAGLNASYAASVAAGSDGGATSPPSSTSCLSYLALLDISSYSACMAQNVTGIASPTQPYGSPSAGGCNRILGWIGLCNFSDLLIILLGFGMILVGLVALLHHESAYDAGVRVLNKPGSAARRAAQVVTS